MSLLLIDLEGVLSDNSERLKTLLESPKKRSDWDRYYNGLIHDEPIEENINLVLEWSGDVLVYTTRFHTNGIEKRWLRDHGLDVDLQMRESYEFRIPGPDLVYAWVNLHDPDMHLDDRVITDL